MPRTYSSVVLLPLTLVFACGSTQTSTKPDGGTTHDAGTPPKADTGNPLCTFTVPTTHRATAPTCSSTRPPSQPGDAGAVDAGHEFGCSYDSQCTQGTNGRCMPEGQIVGCTYDECTTDTSCGTGKICVCGASSGSEGRSPNVCLPSGCLVDSDCGPDGFCSPSYDTTCGAYDGVVGYFCHRAAAECTVDECVNDSDCTGKSDGGFGGTGYCAWNPSASKWGCFFGACAG